MVTRWIFDNDSAGVGIYTFARNPDRTGGDTYWAQELRYSELDVLGSNMPTIHVDGFRGARRALRFTAITGTMMRALYNFYVVKNTITGCRDHLYHTSDSWTPEFSCFISSFMPVLHPTIGTFPGSGEDTWDLDMEIIRITTSVSSI